jgi:hypothetical protein
VRRTAAELVEESSTNQILLPAALRALVGHSYVFQVVISDHTFRTGQLCFQARRVFAAPTIARALPLTGANHGGSSSAENLVPRKDSTCPDKESTNPTSCGTETPVFRDDESTPPPKTRADATAKGSETKGKGVTLASHEEHGYTFVP